MKADTDFSTIFTEMDNADVPADFKWRALFLYIHGLQDYDCLSRYQKEQIHSLMLNAMDKKEYSNENFQVLLKEKVEILNEPYINKMTDAIEESKKLLQEFQDLLMRRKGDVQKLEITTLDAISKGKEPKDIILEVRKSFHKVATIMEKDVATLEHLSKTDKLTGLYNRRGFDEFLEKYIEIAIKGDKPLVLVLIDIDHFKKFNDNFGHLVGDQALAVVAKLIKQTIQEFQQKDVIDYLGARYGGEEFAVIMPDTILEEASIKAENIRKKLERYNFIIRDSQGSIVHKEIKITVSIGVAQLKPEENQLIEFLIDAADKALYTAKSQGRNQVCCY